MNRLLVTPEEEVMLLERMMRPATMPVFTRTELDIALPVGLRIIEDCTVPVRPHPLERMVAEQGMAYRRLQWEIRRGLFLAFLVLSALAVKACSDGEAFLAGMLTTLAVCCIPLHAMAKPADPEVR